MTGLILPTGAGTGRLWRDRDASTVLTPVAAEPAEPVRPQAVMPR